MRKRNTSSLGNLFQIAILLLIIELPHPCAAQEWYAGLSQNDEHYLQLDIDTRKLQRNIRLEKVMAGISYYNSNGEKIADETITFTDPSKLQKLVFGKVYRRFFPNDHPEAASVRGSELLFTRSILGGNLMRIPKRDPVTGRPIFQESDDDELPVVPGNGKTTMNGSTIEVVPESLTVVGGFENTEVARELKGGRKVAMKKGSRSGAGWIYEAAPVQRWWDGAEQKWRLDSFTDGESEYCRIRSMRKRGCLAIQAGVQAIGTQLAMEDCGISENQKWQIIPFHDQSIVIRSKANGMVLGFVRMMDTQSRVGMFFQPDPTDQFRFSNLVDKGESAGQARAEKKREVKGLYKRKLQ